MRWLPTRRRKELAYCAKSFDETEEMTEVETEEKDSEIDKVFASERNLKVHISRKH